MKKKIALVLFAVLATFFVFGPAALAQESGDPAATAVPGSPAGVAARVDTGGPRLRARAEPSLSAPIVARLGNGSVVTVVGRDVTGDWLLIAAPTTSVSYGWASATYLRVDNSAAELPLMTSAPSLPGPVITTTAVITGAPTLAVSPTVTATAAVIPAPASTVIATPPPPPGARAQSAASPVAEARGTIAFPMFDPARETYDVWLVGADGEDLRMVAEQASSPALSQDGSMLAYRRWKVDDRGIVVSSADGINPLRITDKLEDVLPSFSPDRTKVAFSTYRWGDRKSRLYYAWSDEQNKVAWEWGAGGIFGEDPYWATDGRIYYRSTRLDGSGIEELRSMDARSGEDRRLLLVTSSIRAPAVSPDNRHVVYMAYVDGNWELYTLDLIDRTTVRLTDDRAEDGLPTYSPDGDYIAFVSDRGGEWGLYRMEADGENVELIIALPGSIDGRVKFEPDYLNHGWLEEQISWSE